MASADKNTMISNEFRSERKLTNRWVFREEYLNFTTFTLKKKKIILVQGISFFPLLHFACKRKNSIQGWKVQGLLWQEVLILTNCIIMLLQVITSNQDTTWRERGLELLWASNKWLQHDWYITYLVNFVWKWRRRNLKLWSLFWCFISVCPLMTQFMELLI